MIEIINIIFFVFLAVFLILYGQKKNIFFNTSINEKETNFDYQALNLLIVLSIIWISSIFNLNKFIVLLVILMILFFNCIKNISVDKKLSFKIENPLIPIFLITFLLSIIIAHDLFFSHDVRLYWFEKTIMFYNDLFITEDRTIKPEYPHFGTYLWSFFWKFNFLELEYFGRIFYLIIYIFSIFYILEKINFSKIYIKYFLLIFLVLLSFKIKWFDGRQDILVFSFNNFIFGFLYELISNKSKKMIHIFGIILSMNLLLWTKNDTFLYVITYSFIIFIYLKNDEKLKLIIGIIGIILIKFIFYKIYKVSLNPNLDTFGTNIIEHIQNIDVLYRFLQVGLWYFIGILRNPILFISIILMFVFINDINFQKYSYFILAYVIISLGIFSVYLITKYDFPFHMIGSVGRVFLQFSMIFVIPILKFCEKKKLV